MADRKYGHGALVVQVWGGLFSLLHYASPGAVLCIDEVVISIGLWVSGSRAVFS